MDHTIIIAPFRLGLNPDGSLQETSGRCFDLKAYSRMNYGARTDVQYLAQELPAELLLKPPQLFTGVQPPALLTAYKAAAPPATTLARYCLDIMNLARFQANVAPGELVQVYRPQDYIEEYAILPAADRKRLIGSQTANSLRGRSLAGFTPVILDDIYVTGTYTAMMRQVLKHYEEVITAYVVVCDDTLKNTPDAEGRLNNAAIHHPSDLLPFIEQGN